MERIQLSLALIVAYNTLHETSWSIHLANRPNRHLRRSKPNAYGFKSKRQNRDRILAFRFTEAALTLREEIIWKAAAFISERSCQYHQLYQSVQYKHTRTQYGRREPHRGGINVSSGTIVGKRVSYYQLSLLVRAHTEKYFNKNYS